MPDKIYTRPRDQSLEAYKGWIQGLALRLNPNAKDTTTEEEWVEKWKQFWNKDADLSDTQNSEEKR